MDMHKEFKRQYRRYSLNICGQNALYSLFVSSIFTIVTSLILWYNGYPTWIDAIVFVGGYIFVFGIFMLLNCPNDNDFLTTMDSLGLQQRAITMKDFKNDVSLMARVQRENAIEHIKNVDPKQIKCVIPLVMTILTSIAVLLGAGSVTAATLASQGQIKTGKEVVEEVIPSLVNTYEITYDVKGDGYIEGEEFQVIEEGEDGTVVEAIAEEGFAFYCWSDFNDNPIRQEKNVTSNIELFAYFVELEDSGDPQSGDGDGDGQPSDQEQNGKPSNSSSQGDKDGDQNTDMPGGTSGGGEYEPANQVVDGETYYGGSTFNNAYDDVIESGENNEVVDDYFNNIQK